MTDSIPITPPPELVREWMERTEYDEHTWFYESYIAEQAAQWGADQELEACCDWLDRNNQWARVDIDELHDARRPKPPSAVAQAEALIERYEDGWCPSPAQWHVIREGLAEGRRALEQLDD